MSPIIAKPTDLPLVPGCKNAWQSGDGIVGIRTGLSFTAWQQECETVYKRTLGLVRAPVPDAIAYYAHIVDLPGDGAYGKRAQWWVTIHQMNVGWMRRLSGRLVLIILPHHGGIEMSMTLDQRYPHTDKAFMAMLRGTPADMNQQAVAGLDAYMRKEIRAWWGGWLSTITRICNLE